MMEADAVDVTIKPMLICRFAYLLIGDIMGNLIIREQCQELKKKTTILRQPLEHFIYWIYLKVLLSLKEIYHARTT